MIIITNDCCFYFKPQCSQFYKTLTLFVKMILSFLPSHLIWTKNKFIITVELLKAHKPLYLVNVLCDLLFMMYPSVLTTFTYQLDMECLFDLGSFETWSHYANLC